MRAEAAPFDLAGDDRGVLCIHGFTGTPFEMRHLGYRLHQRGMTAVCPLLPGHGTSPGDLDRTTWIDWYGAVEVAFDELRSRCSRVAVAGLSLGGLLALHLARSRGDQMAAVAALSAPIWLPPLSRAAIGLTRRLPRVARAVSGFPKLGGADVRDPAMRRANPSYRVMPVRAVHQLTDFMAIVRAELGEIRVPTLVLHARRDHTAPYECSEEVAARLGAEVVRHRPLDESFHLITIDVERDVVANEVGGFFETFFDAERARHAN